MNEKDINQLSEPDAQAMDCLIEAGLDLERVPAQHQPRARKAMELLGLLDHLPQQSAGDILVYKTMERINRQRQQERFTRQADSLTGPSAQAQRWRISVRDLLAVAAMFLIGISLVWPMINGSAENAANHNIAGAGMGDAAYSNIRTASTPAKASQNPEGVRLGDPWWLLDRPTAVENTAPTSHVFVLTPQGYVNIGSTRSDSVTLMPPGVRDLPSSVANSFAAPGNLQHRMKLTLTPQPVAGNGMGTLVNYGSSHPASNDASGFNRSIFDAIDPSVDIQDVAPSNSPMP